LGGGGGLAQPLAEHLVSDAVVLLPVYRRERRIEGLGDSLLAVVDFPAYNGRTVTIVEP
jgi:hypothetical protein